MEPLCRTCSKRGHITVATVVDHITEHKGDRDLFFAFSNTQSLCAPCHDSEKQSIEARGYDKAIGEDGWPIDEAHPANACGGGIQAQPAEISARQLQGKS
nr:HNH endonuclease [Rhizobium rhizolycopersici]